MLEITNKTRSRPSKGELLLYKKIWKTVLGAKYELSIVISTDKQSAHNILAFPLSSSDGEIFINQIIANKEATFFGRTPIAHRLALIIHACAHLAGHRHGKKMNLFERRIHNKLLPNL